MAIATTLDVYAEAERRYLKFDEDRYSEDVIEDMIDQAEAILEAETGQVWAPTTFTQYWNGSELGPYQPLTLDHYPVLAATVLTDGTTKTADSDYYLYEEGIVKPGTPWPSTGWKNVQINYSAGRDSTDKSYKLARAAVISLVVLTMFLSRETPSSIKLLVTQIEEGSTMETTSRETLNMVYDIQMKFNILRRGIGMVMV